jgi:hypothetical protein
LSHEIVRVKVCLTEPAEFVAVMVIIAACALFDVPWMVAVPFAPAVNVTPLGRAPDSVRVAVGRPVVVSVNIPGLPLVNVVFGALVKAGATAALMVRVNVWLG